MTVLVIGGTAFVGRTFTQEALERGWTVTHFNRGKTDAGAFPNVETINGDRYEDLNLLFGRRWDAVVDTCGYTLSAVEMSCAALQDATDRYLFISTISTYDNEKEQVWREDSPLLTEIEDPYTMEITGQTYGPLKVRCEQAVQSAFRERALIVRPGLIIGPFDTTDRFTYWPMRFARGGAALCPLPEDRHCAGIDVRDLARFLADLLAARASGIFNADAHHTWGELIEACEAAAGDEAATPVWTDPVALEAAGARPWLDLPFWLPDGSGRADLTKSHAAGLTHRPLADTVRDTLEWARIYRPGLIGRVGLTPEAEAEVIHTLATGSSGNEPVPQ